jgi:hypothetical protein
MGKKAASHLGPDAPGAPPTRRCMHVRLTGTGGRQPNDRRLSAGIALPRSCQALRWGAPPRAEPRPIRRSGAHLTRDGSPVEPGRAHIPWGRLLGSARTRLARLTRGRGVRVGRGIGPVSRFIRRWCVDGMSRRRSRRRRRLSFGHAPGLARGLGRTAVAALCDCRRSACRACSKQSEHRRLATAPSRALAGLGGRLSAAARQHSLNYLHQLLRAALLRLAAAQAGCTAALSCRSSSEAPYLGLTGPSRETPRSLSLTGGAATKTPLSQRCGLPPPLCRPRHAISSPN